MTEIVVVISAIDRVEIRNKYGDKNDFAFLKFSKHYSHTNGWQYVNSILLPEYSKLCFGFDFSIENRLLSRTVFNFDNKELTYIETYKDNDGCKVHLFERDSRDRFFT